MSQTPRSSPAPLRTPSAPSFPTRRSRRVRDAIFVLSAVAWAGAIYAVGQRGRAQALTGEPRELAVFTEAFEQNLRMRFAVKAFGRNVLAGEIVRRTKEPYEGRLIVRTKGRTERGSLGAAHFLEFYEETRWDRTSGGFVMSSMRVRWFLPEPLGRTDIRATATRDRTPGAGDLLVLTDTVTKRVLREPIPIAEGTDLSAGLMQAAPVRAMYVGARWKSSSVNPISRELEPAEVQVVEEGRVPIQGPVRWGFKAVTRVEKETGRRVEQATTWYDREGRALVQLRKLVGIELVLERIERLPASDDEWEKMSPRTDGDSHHGATESEE